MKVHIVEKRLLSEHEILGMETLYHHYYSGAPAEKFRRDIESKDYVILIFNEDRIEGFSTQKVVLTGDKNVLYSGDTIVAEESRCQFGLAGAFGHLMHYLQTEFYPPHSLYWFLICKGARTYRFLPTFFRRFYPCPDECDYELQGLVREFAQLVFPEDFDSRTGILRFHDGDHLKTDVLRNDAASVFFRKLNPGWPLGDELCCIAPLAMDNLNKKGLRVIKAVNPQWRIMQ